MKSIGFFNNKGGVGKTTLLCNLAASLALNSNKNILILDADPQCNASAYLLSGEVLNDVLLDDSIFSIDSFYDSVRKGQGYSSIKPSVVKSERFGVDVIVGSPKLSLREDLIATDWVATKNGDPRGFQTTYAIKELLSRYETYDYIFIDMGPSLGALNRSILLSIDYFLMPLSVDIFSLMAINNIISSFQSWRDSITQAVENYSKAENSKFSIGNKAVGWDIKFLGYVTQQYTAKKNKDGERRAVAAFEKIIEKQKVELKNLALFFGVPYEDLDMGNVPTLSSVIPLSQQAHAPVFELGSADGIVGAHYTRVSEAGEFFHAIASSFVQQVKQ